MIIVSGKVKQKFKPVKEFPNLSTKPIPTKLLLFGEVYLCIDTMTDSEWLAIWKPTAHHYSQKIKDKLNAKRESEYMYTAFNNQKVVVIFDIA